MEPATPTARAQRDLETRIASIYRDLADLDAAGRVHRVHRGDDALCLQRGRHARYAGAGLGRLPASFASLDASRPWICFWVLHSLALLGAPLPEGIAADDVVAFLGACAAEGGGYGGGPGQMAHLAPTYAAVAALLTLGGEAAYESIDRAAVAAFLRRMAVPPERGGGFTMHEGGEADARACYTAVAVASMLNLDVESLAAASGVVDYLQRCQTYEGGLGGCPGNEAHGGYTYCGAAALALLDALPALDLPRLARWLAQRQGTVEGGFNGRTNKLVDGCYSFWQGAALPLVARERARLEAAALRPGTVRPGDLDLDVPPLPPLPGVATPYDEAVREAARLSDRAEELVARAVAAEAAVLKQQEQRRKAAADEAAAAASAGAAGATAASSDGDGRQQQQQQQPQQQQQQEAAPERKASTPVTSPRSGTDAEREARRLLRKAEEAQRVRLEGGLVWRPGMGAGAHNGACLSLTEARASPTHTDSFMHPLPTTHNHIVFRRRPRRPTSRWRSRSTARRSSSCASAPTARAAPAAAAAAAAAATSSSRTRASQRRRQASSSSSSGSSKERWAPAAVMTAAMMARTRQTRRCSTPPRCRSGCSRAASSRSRAACATSPASRRTTTTRATA